MNIETFKNAGISFDYCPDKETPEIPRVQDVLFAMRLSEEENAYTFCVKNHHTTYVVNVALVVASVGYQVLGMGRYYDEAVARKVIAEMIISLCPPSARCLFNTAFVEAKILAGEKMLPQEQMSYEMILNACPCAKCRQRVLENIHDIGGLGY